MNFAYGDKIRVYLLHTIKYPERRIDGISYTGGEYYSLVGAFAGWDEHGVSLSSLEDTTWGATVPNDMIGFIEKVAA